jgi:threonine dehydratase
MYPTFHMIEKAEKQIEGVLTRTPLVYSQSLSRLINTSLYLKLENLQKTASFKTRGTLVKMATLTVAERARGVVAMSAGNHAQGVAYHAQNLKIPATIVMPKDTPLTKVQRTQDLGAQVILDGETLKESARVASMLAEEKGCLLIHPYDDPHIIVGQGTVGLEIMQDLPDLEALVVPIGGGGLMAGCAIAAKTKNPKIKIIGVQARNFPFMLEALNKPTPGQQERVSLAEGIAVKTPGKLTQEIIGRLVDELVTVTEEKIEKAMYLLATQQKIIAEGAGAAALAALISYPELVEGRKTAVIISGGNVDSRILASILMRGMAHEAKIIRLLVGIPDVPGILAQICEIIGKLNGNIIEITHQRLFNAASPKNTDLDLLIEIRNEDHAHLILSKLQDHGFPTRWIRDAHFS